VVHTKDNRDKTFQVVGLQGGRLLFLGQIRWVSAPADNSLSTPVQSPAEQTTLIQGNGG